MYIVTGGAGFIGSAMVWLLNGMGHDKIVVVDNLGHGDKWKNLVNLRYQEYLHRDEFAAMVRDNRVPWSVQGVVHMGACSSTTETDAEFLMANNFRYSRSLCRWCLDRKVRFINASSAATYGDGSQGFSDDHAGVEGLKPLNMYGYTKQLFDLWALRTGAIQGIVSLKFFNVFGPNEYHKGDMRSMICKAYEQIRNAGSIKLFKSYREEYPDGGQLRDFVYVKDCVEVMRWFLENPDKGGIYNVGTGKARSWNDLAKAVFAALEKEPRIEYVEMPEVLQGKYQYYTQSEQAKLAGAGCDVEFTGLEQAVKDYVRNYLAGPDPYL